MYPACFGHKGLFFPVLRYYFVRSTNRKYYPHPAHRSIDFFHAIVFVRFVAPAAFRNRAPLWAIAPDVVCGTIITNVATVFVRHVTSITSRNCAFLWAVALGVICGTIVTNVATVFVRHVTSITSRNCAFLWAVALGVICGVYYHIDMVANLRDRMRQKAAMFTGRRVFFHSLPCGSPGI